ncbi:MAG: PKD domain-containing protein [Muribaculaceae bacterium]|nr:PKD domain-containing protein [Muribaculaceae bacterium]
MKYIKNIGLLAVMVLAMVSCVESTPDYGNFPSKDVDFTYNVDGDEFLLDFYVVSTIDFNNTSAKGGAATWDFGDGTAPVTTSDKAVSHKYTTAGNYQVKLTVEGVGSRTYPILIYDIAPVLSVAKQSQTPVVINDATVEMSIFLPNPASLKCKYDWVFPEGTQRLVNGKWEAVESWTGYSDADGNIEYPGELKFKNIGSQKIEIRTWFDIEGENRRLEDSYANVQVGCNYPCKTVYYAVKDGNIKAYKLVDMTKVPEGTKVGAFDLGVKSGTMPTQLVYAKYDGADYIYIVDCGKQYTYINDEEGTNGDGKISVMNADGSVTDIFVTNVGGDAFADPFQACAYDGYLYYTDRNSGIRQMALNKRGEVETTHHSYETGYFVVNGQLGYYGKGIAYGAIHTSIQIDSKGMIYWAKNYSGNGVYRFQASDIGKLSDIPHPILISGANIRAFAVDEARQKMYAWMSKGNIGFNAYALPGYDESKDLKATETFINMDADGVNSTADEGIFVTQFAIDSTTGNVFFGFNASTTEKTYKTGLKYFDINTKKIVNFNDNNEKILGIAICDTETNLF